MPMMNMMNMMKDEITKNPCNRIGEFNNFGWISDSVIIISLLPSPMVVKSFLRELSQYEQNMPLKICVPSQRTSLALSSQDSHRKYPSLNMYYSSFIFRFSGWIWWMEGKPFLFLTPMISLMNGGKFHSQNFCLMDSGKF